MNVDSQGKRRGSCNRCPCKEFAKQKSSVKCGRCGHAPTLHSHMLIDLTTDSAEAASSQFAHHVNENNIPKTPDVKNAVSSHQGYHRQSSWSSEYYWQDPRQPCCHKCSTVYPVDIGACPICFKRDNCPCGQNLKFFDPIHGVFPYCSPSCRDKCILPEYNKKLKEDLSNPLHMNGTPVCVDLVSIIDASSHAVGTGSAGMQGVVKVNTQKSKQTTISEPLPRIRSCVLFYTNVWSEDGKYGLFITGLKLEEDTSLLLADLICGTSAENFNSKTSYDEMIAKYKGGTLGRIIRKYDLKLICKKAKQKGLSGNCDKANSFAFFLRKTEVFGVNLNLENDWVVVSAVIEGSIAEFSGIKANDIIQSIGSVNSDQVDTIEFKDVTEKEHVTSVFEEQPSAIFGFILIIQRPIVTKYV